MLRRLKQTGQGPSPHFWTSNDRGEYVASHKSERINRIIEVYTDWCDNLSLVKSFRVLRSKAPALVVSDDPALYANMFDRHSIGLPLDPYQFMQFSWDPDRPSTAELFPHGAAILNALSLRAANRYIYAASRDVSVLGPDATLVPLRDGFDRDADLSPNVSYGRYARPTAEGWVYHPRGE